MTVSISGTNGLIFNDASTQNTSAFTGGFAFRNRLINSDMRIDQRNAGASVTPAAAAYTLDRWKADMSQASKYSVRQNAGSVANGGSVVAPAGFTSWLGATSLAATTVGAGDYFYLWQAIEGLNCGDLGWGTANAQTVTLSFRVYSSLTGTFGGAIQNSASNRSYPFTYTVSSANTWTTISITIAGDTSGTWLTTNGIGMYVNFNLGTGTTYSGTAGAWAGSNYVSATGSVQVVATNGATFYITGVQLEKGSTATSFDYRPYGTELALCQRYYQAGSHGLSASNASGYGQTVIPALVTFRSTPTFTTTLGGAFITSTSINTTSTCIQLTALGANQPSAGLNYSFTSSAEL